MNDDEWASVEAKRTNGNRKYVIESEDEEGDTNLHENNPAHTNSRKIANQSSKKLFDSLSGTSDAKSKTSMRDGIVADSNTTPNSAPISLNRENEGPFSASKTAKSLNLSFPVEKNTYFQQYLNPKDWEIPKSNSPKDANYKPAWMRGTKRTGKRSVKSVKEKSKGTYQLNTTQTVSNCEPTPNPLKQSSNKGEDSMISNISTLSEDNNDVSEPKAKLANSSFVENQCYVGNSEGIEPDTTTNTPTQTLKRNTDTTTSIIPEEVKPEKQQLERNLVLAESNSATREEKQFKKKPKRSILDQFFAPNTKTKRQPLLNTSTEKVGMGNTSLTLANTGLDASSSNSLISRAQNSIVEQQQPSSCTIQTLKDKNQGPDISSEMNAGCSFEDFNPSSARYDPVRDACWGRYKPVPYCALATAFSMIEATPKRLEIVSIICNFFRSVIALSPMSMIPCVYLCTNSLAPAYEGIELGIGDSILMKAIQIASGRSIQKIRADFATIGDLGEVAAQSQSTQRKLSFAKKGKPLTVDGVFQKLKTIATLKGQNSQTRKVELIQGLLLASCSSQESKYLIRALGGKLRIGLAELSVLSALGQAVALTPPGKGDIILDASKGKHPEKFKETVEECTLKIKTVYCELPNYDHIIPILMTKGVDAMAKLCCITPGIPMKPMLAQPTKGVEEVLQRLDGKTFVCEYKYDGERAQVHRDSIGNITIYSRNSENNTSKYPDIIANLPAAVSESTQDFVLDCEAVAYDFVNHHILPFQVLSTRKRKDATEDDVEVQVCLFAFDLLYINGQSLVKEPLEERRRLLHEHFKSVQGRLQFADSLVTAEVDEIALFLEKSIKESCEGLMIKTLKEDASYEIARRSNSWLKLKKDYLDGVGDTLDLVVLAAWFGKGKRTGAYGAFLLGCYDDEAEEYQTICKIGTGFSDEDLKCHHEQLKEHVIPSPRNYYRFDTTIEPDQWFDAVQVWEVKAADLSISPRHKAAAGLVDPEKGISLRFPRFIRVREDKKPEMATSAYQVASMYNSQQLVQNTRNRAAGPPPR